MGKQWTRKGSLESPSEKSGDFRGHKRRNTKQRWRHWKLNSAVAGRGGGSIRSIPEDLGAGVVLASPVLDSGSSPGPVVVWESGQPVAWVQVIDEPGPMGHCQSHGAPI